MAKLETFEYVDLLRRIRAEFDELPGMCLTCEQTARLMGVDRATCARALQDLTASGFVTRHGLTYARADRQCESQRRTRVRAA